MWIKQSQARCSSQGCSETLLYHFLGSIAHHGACFHETLCSPQNTPWDLLQYFLWLSHQCYDSRDMSRQVCDVVPVCRGLLVGLCYCMTYCSLFFCLFPQTEKETFLDPFILRDLLPASLGSYYRYTGSLTTPPCSEIVEWIVFRKPVPISYHQVDTQPPKGASVFVCLFCIVLTI